MGRDRVRVLFVCWGYSIHAERRMRIFTEDRRFEVMVVSTHDYALSHAEGVLLTGAQAAPATGTGKRVVSRLPLRLRATLKRMLQILTVPRELARMRRDMRLLREAAVRFSPDVVFLQTLQYPSFLAYGLPRHLRMIVTFWNGDLTHFARWTGMEWLAKKRLVVHGLNRVDAITVNSQAAMRAAVSLGADPRKITLIRYPGADLALFQPRDRAECRARLRVHASNVVLCPRGLGPFFNSEVIVHAAARLVATHPDTLFLFVSGVGGEAEWARHVALAERLGIAGKLRWDGHVPWPDMPLYYGAADAMVSIMEADSCPNCMLEAMACATPLVMSDTPQNREWIEDGRSGFLCGPRDPAAVSAKLALILDTPALADGFAALALEKVRRDADSAVNSERIRRIVIGLGGRTVARPRGASAQNP